MKKLLTILALSLIFITPVQAKETWEYQDTIDVKPDGSIELSAPLEEGYKYKFVVSGTYFAGDGITADAKCSFRESSSTEWSDLVSTYESYGPELLDLLVNGDSNWGDYCSPDHTYSQIIVGDGSQASFQIYDTYYSNNSGSLSVEIYKFWKETGVKAETCTTIQSGNILSSDGNIIETGFDQWGYNYQARLFNGLYCDAYRDAAWCQDYKEDSLSMKWNDAWLSNKDCDGDGELDRHYGFDSYIGSGAWLTNHQSGEYLDNDGELCKWNYFVKIVAVPSDATPINGVWYSADNVEIGPVIWGAFAIVQEVENDSCVGSHGLQYLSPLNSGLGSYMP